MPKIAALNIVGDHNMRGHGCRPMTAVGAGLVMMELSRIDSSIATFFAVHLGLAMQSINLLGSEAQRQHYLPQMARFEKVGAFALTEPDHGSDSVALETTAKREGDEWVINGHKRWPGNAVWCDYIVVYARDVADKQVKAFVVEKDNPGYKATKIGGKVSLRMVQNADITLTDCRVREDARLQNCNSFKDCARVLMGTRNTVAWASLGNAVSAYDIALTYAQRRIQFGKPIAKSQMIQSILVNMLGDVTAMQLYAHPARPPDRRRASWRRRSAALAKYYCSVSGRDVCRMARDVPRRQRHHARFPCHAPYVRHGEPGHLRRHRRDPVPDRRSGHHRSERFRLIAPGAGRALWVTRAAAQSRRIARRRRATMRGVPSRRLAAPALLGRAA